MFGLPISITSLVFLALHIAISIAAVLLARAHLGRVQTMLSGQTRPLVPQLARLPEAERLDVLRRKASADSIEWRIADEALQVGESHRAAAVDAVLADVSLGLEERSLWPRAAARIAGSSGVLLMALALALRLEVFVAAILLVGSIVSVIVCLSIGSRAAAISAERCRDIDALVDVLGLRGPAQPRRPQKATSVKSRRTRRS